MVASLNSWVNIQDFTTNSPNSFAVSAGVERALMVAVHGEADAATTPSLSGVTYGGKSLTKLHDQVCSTPSNNVALLDAWTADTIAPPQPAVAATATISAGTSRLLLIVVTAEATGIEADMNYVTYGGQTLTEIEEVNGATSSGVNQRLWAGYLDEVGIQAASGTNILLYWNTAPQQPNTATAAQLSWGVYQYVDQSDPIADSGSIGTTASPAGDAISLSVTGLNVPAGSQVIGASTYQTQSYSYTTQSGYSVPSGFPFSGGGVSTNTNVITTRDAFTADSNHTTTCAWVTAGGRQCMAAFVVRSEKPQNYLWFGYLLEADIASAVGTTLLLDWSVAPNKSADPIAVTWGSYQNVDQVDPVASSGVSTSGSNNTTGQTVSGLYVPLDAQVVQVSTHGTLGTTYTPQAGYQERLDADGTATAAKGTMRVAVSTRDAVIQILSHDSTSLWSASGINITIAAAFNTAHPRVELLDSWAYVSTTSPGSATRTVSAGTWTGDHKRRLLLVAVYGNSTTGRNADISSVTFGGQTLTEIQDDTAIVGGEVENYLWLGYLDDAGIVAASSTTIAVNWTTTPNTGANPVAIANAVYQYVDQINPVKDSGSYAGHSAGSGVKGLEVPKGSKVVQVACYESTGVGYTPQVGYTELLDVDIQGRLAVATRTSDIESTSHASSSKWTAKGRNCVIACVLEFEGVWGRDAENGTDAASGRFDFQGGMSPPWSGMLVRGHRQKCWGSAGSARFGVYIGGVSGNELGDPGDPVDYDVAGPKGATLLKDYGAINPLSTSAPYTWSGGYDFAGSAWAKNTPTWCAWSSTTSFHNTYVGNNDWGDFVHNAFTGVSRGNRYTHSATGTPGTPLVGTLSPLQTSTACYGVQLKWGYAFVSAAYLTVDVMGNPPASLGDDASTLLFDGTAGDFGEPSGLAWDDVNKKLWACDDAGFIASMDRDGTNSRQERTDFAGLDTEEIVVPYPELDTLVYVVRERDFDADTQIYEFDSADATWNTTGKSWILDEAPRALDDPSNYRGCECCEFVPDPRHSLGGVWYVGRQVEGNFVVYEIDLTTTGTGFRVLEHGPLLFGTGSDTDGFHYERGRNIFYVGKASVWEKYSIGDPQNPTLVRLNWASGQTSLAKGDGRYEGLAVMPKDGASVRKFCAGGDSLTNYPGVHATDYDQKGEINAVGGVDYKVGDQVNLTATPVSGYQVKAWVGTDDDGSTSTTNIVTLSAGQNTVTVEFEAISGASIPSAIIGKTNRILGGTILRG